MTKRELLDRIGKRGRYYFKDGSSRPLRAGEKMIVYDAINSVWKGDEEPACHCGCRALHS